MQKKVLTLGLVAAATAVTLTSSVDTMGITAPASGDFLYDVYDIAVNKILKGAIGFVAGVGIVAYGVFMALRNALLPALLAFIGGGIIIKADAIVTSLGSNIN